MEERRNDEELQATQASSFEGKKEWKEPKLTFVKPKLTNHGRLEQVTGGAAPPFFGGFTPTPSPG
jgi:hypothetical protein